MKFSVNDNCIGCGLCPSICPEVFEMTDGNVARAKDIEIDIALEGSAKEAQNSCPVSAIEME